MKLARLLELPLLTKELVERAARRRTYLLRVLFALALYIFFWTDNRYRLRTGQPLELLGIGDDLFESLTIILFVGIYVFVPATMCGVITQEKERDSLVLLLLTPLRPWRIVLQKYLGGLIPSLTILILALPLGAVCYTFGGFTPRELLWTLAILLLAVLQIGALAVWCSALFRTTGAAFIGTYAFAAALTLVPGLIVMAETEYRLGLLGEYAENLLGCHLPPVVWLFTKYASAQRPQPLVGCLLIIATTVLFLLLATYHLPRRAFAPPKAFLRLLFAKLDRTFHRLNRFVGGLTFRPRTQTLPGSEPIIWREKRARALAKPEHLTRLFVALLLPVVALVLFITVMSAPGRGQAEGFSLIGAAFGIFCILVLAVMGSNCIVHERVKQTFEVLITTPLSAGQIVAEKSRALRPLMLVLAMPLLIIFATEAWFEADVLPGATYLPGTFRYVVCFVGTVFLQLSIVVWLSLWIGMWCRTRIRALGTSLGVIIGWCVLPFVLLSIFDLSDASDSTGILFLLSPLTVPALNEMNELDSLGHIGPWTLVLLNFALYGTILILLRRHCLTRAEAYLRRY
jgi:ABC-type transport system involved in multi-copper enzyme maturation permease subunit